MEVAQTIYKQLGGGRFEAMTGSKPIKADEKSLTIKLTKNKSRANELKITLNGLDLYKVEFIKHTYPRLDKKTWGWIEDTQEEIKTFNDVYGDQLENIFTEVTGMYTRL